MNLHRPSQPFLALVDDDSHSARLMIRMLLAHGAPSVSWMQDAGAGLTEIGTTLDDDAAALPGLVIVDLKSTSRATVEFIETLRGLEHGGSLQIAAMASTLERQTREGLLAAGADAVFERHGNIDLYRREAAAIVSFWVRNQRLDAVGT